MKTVLVLTAIERAFYSATIEYQLIEPLLKVSERRKETCFIFLFLVPISFYFIRVDMRRSFSLFRKRRRELKDYLEEKDCKAIFIPVLFPVKHKSFYLRIFEIPIFLLTNLPLLLLFFMLYPASVIHARGYPAGLLAYIYKRLKRVRFLFDMRDVYTKKGVEAGVFKENDISLKLWNSIEKRMFDSADSLIVTSYPFKHYVSNIVKSDEKIWIIPNSVNRKKFFSDVEVQKSVRKRLGIEDRFIIIHSGTFSTQEDIGLAVRYFKKWKDFSKDSFFLILTANRMNIEKITRVFEKENVVISDYRIINPEPEEVPYLLKTGDIGLHLESKSLATEYCIAIKDGEYLATGLPVVCTPYLKGIAPLIGEYDCGIIIDPDKDETTTKEKYLLDNFERIKKNTKKIVDEVLSLDIAAQKWDKCYRNLLKNI